jgi:FdhD protein
VEASAHDAPHAPEVRRHGLWASVRLGGFADEVAVEEPLEIRMGGETLAITMRTPGHDEELVTGWLLAEGLTDGPVALGPPQDLAANTIEITGPLAREPDPRRFTTTSACGVCGAGAVEDVAAAVGALPPGPVVPRDLLATLPDRLVQPGFARTGGLHAAGLFTNTGEPLVVREDVGRHNALDKAVGRALLDGHVPLRDALVCVSGRLSYELVQKAARAGAPVLVGVGAPSSLAVETAAACAMTLAGFARGGRVNVYSGAERVTST